MGPPRLTNGGGLMELVNIGCPWRDSCVGESIFSVGSVCTIIFSP